MLQMFPQSTMPTSKFWCRVGIGPHARRSKGTYGISGCRARQRCGPCGIPEAAERMQQKQMSHVSQGRLSSV
eukprot:2398109-Amphidinium_carterae.1